MFFGPALLRVFLCVAGVSCVMNHNRYQWFVLRRSLYLVRYYVWCVSFSSVVGFFGRSGFSGCACLVLIGDVLGFG